MATVVELDVRGDLCRYDPNLRAGEQEFRCLYGSPRFVGWVQNDLPNLGSTWGIDQSPTEQFDAYMEIFASDEPLYFGWAFKPLVHLADGVWELKTADLRIFGWFSAKDCFIAYVADTKERIRLHRFYNGYAQETLRFRTQLDLNEPKFVLGDDPHAVISNFDHP